MLFNFNKDKLYFLREYKYHGAYSTENRTVSISLNDILKKFKNTSVHSDDEHYHIVSKFNGIYYPLFDLDSEQNLKLFKELFDNQNYVIFRSSNEHYWAFLDMPYKNIRKIYQLTEWHNCNDPQFVEYSMGRECLHIRALYECEGRKPILSDIYGNLSKNFNDFINKLDNFYKGEALELSILKYKDENLLRKFNRRKKLERLNNIEQNSEK